MPCNMGMGSSGTSHYEVEKIVKEQLMMASPNFVAACLCAVLTVLDKFDQTAVVMRHIDQDEAGIETYYLRKWWEEHKAADERRREKERKKSDGIATSSPDQPSGSVRESGQSDI